MSASTVVQPFTLRGVVVRYRRLPSNWIEILLYGYDPKFRAKLRKSAENAGYVQATEETKGGNLRCYLPPSKQMSFDKLISKLLTKFVGKIERNQGKLSRLFRQQQHTEEIRDREYGDYYRALATA